MSNPADKLYDFDTQFVRGAASNTDPGSLPVGSYWMTMNMLASGGLLSCRPGYRWVANLPIGKLQGTRIFQPRLGLEQILAAVDGVLYVADWPFADFRPISTIRFSPTASQIFWSGDCDQSAQRTDLEAFDSAIEVLPVPRRMLIMQDGITAPAYWDGGVGTHIRDYPYQTPIGGPMCWVGDRLWVASGDTVYASDIANPLSFREQIYLGGAGGFTMPESVTAMARLPDVTAPQLLVFTASTCSQLMANVRSRETWPAVDGFQSRLFDVGAVGQRSVVSHFGQLSWFAPSGFTRLDMAVASKHTSRLPTRDDEMAVSKSQLSGDLSLIAGAAYGKYTLMSVPASDAFNVHTWVYSDAAIETVTGDQGAVWVGYWTGTRPVEWASSLANGEEHLYHVSADADGVNRLWEAFQSDQRDDGNAITWAFWSRGYFGVGAPTQKAPGRNALLRFSDVALSGVNDLMDLGVWFVGGVRGQLVPIANVNFQVVRGSLNPNVPVTGDGMVVGFKAQSRTVRTADPYQNEDSCGTEKDKFAGEDEFFQFLVVGQGPGTLRWLRVQGDIQPEEPSSNPDALTRDTEALSGVRFDGLSATAATVAEIATALSAPVPVFTSTKTVVQAYAGGTYTGTWTATSIISQEVADRVALTAATLFAEAQVAAATPPTVSAGLGLL